MAGQMDPAWAGGHGGGEETSAILYIDAKLVDRDAMKPCDVAPFGGEIEAVSMDTGRFRGVTVSIPRDARPIAANGWYGPDDIFKATYEQGEAMLTAIADYAAAFIEEFKKVEIR